MAILLDIEGIDGSGKGTQALRLLQALQARGTRAELLSFPRYSQTRFGGLVGRFLNGEFGELPHVHPQLAALLYAGDRFESRSRLQSALSENDVLVLDRYVASNVAHQSARLDGEQRSDLASFIDWLEHDLYQLPRPDLIVLLDLPVSSAQRQIAQKQQRDYTEREADIQEADAGYLARVRQAYHELADAGAPWTVIECQSESTVRSIEDIAGQLWDLVLRQLGNARSA